MCLVCPSWLSFILYNPIRKTLTDRERVLRESGIERDSVVLEVGAGNGFFTEVLAGHAGKVYAVEFQPGMVRKLRKRVGDRVTIVQCDIASCGLQEDLADVCLMYYSFHEVKDKAGAAGTISRALKAGGILSIYEPSIEVNRREMGNTAEIFERLGFRKEAERHGLFTRFVRLKKT